MFRSRVLSGIVALCIAVGGLWWVLEPSSVTGKPPVVVDSQFQISADISPTSVTAPNAGADTDTVFPPAEICYTRAQLTADPDAALAQQWLSRNLIDSIGLPQQTRTFTVAQLEAEAASGDVDAMFKLGVKYMWAGIKSHDDPHLNANPLTPEQQQLYVDKSRFWFWQAALHGRLQSFLELSHAFTSIHRHNNNIAPSSEITPLSAAYQLLMQEINPDLAWAMGVRVEHILLKAEDKVQVAQLLAALRSQWQQQRQELGQPFKLDLVVPDYVKTIEQKLAKLCPSEWHQPTP